MVKAIIPVSHYRQLTPWSCGPASLQMVLGYHGDARTHSELIEGTNCTADGTLTKGFRTFLNRLGYKYLEKQKARIRQLEGFVDKNIPVIVAYQAYRDGHFSVVVGYDNKRILIADPFSSRKFRWIPKQDFKRRWYGEDEPGKTVRRWMLAVYPKN